MTYLLSRNLEVLAIGSHTFLDKMSALQTQMLIAFLTLLALSFADGITSRSIFAKARQYVGEWINTAVAWFPTTIRRVFYNVERHVIFKLYSRDGKSQVLIKGNRSSILSSKFDVDKTTKLIIHGWLSSPDIYFAKQIRDAYLEHHDYNVVAVDWSRFAGLPYTCARISIHFVGPEVAKFMDFLVDEIGVDPNKVHILGHSLGAHIAGLAGGAMKCNVSRITGMDPAMPLIVGDASYRLDASQAQFVDVIHTSIYFLGVYQPTGHADFYPNGGGPLQPGCGVSLITASCTHRRSYKYFAESIQNPKGFMALKCHDWNEFVSSNCSTEYAYMGEGVSNKARGKFYLRTATVPPYGLGDIKLGWNRSKVEHIRSAG